MLCWIQFSINNDYCHVSVCPPPLSSHTRTWFHLRTSSSTPARHQILITSRYLSTHLSSVKCPISFRHCWTQDSYSSSIAVNKTYHLPSPFVSESPSVTIMSDITIVPYKRSARRKKTFFVQKWPVKTVCDSYIRTLQHKAPKFLK